MPRVLIAGCGYLGQATADLFVAANWEVQGWTRSAESAAKLSEKPYRVQAVDIAGAKEVTEVTENFDAVVHCASTRGGDAGDYRRVYRDGVRHLIEWFRGSAIVFTSSTSVYAQAAGESVTEGSPAEPIHETAKILREAEELVLAGGGIVARLGAIYGPDRSFLLKNFLAGRASIDPSTDRFVNQIHRDDAATALLRLVVESRPAGIFNVIDDDPIRLSDCYRWLAAKLNRPISAVERSASVRKRGESNKRVSNSKLRALGWEPKYPNFAEGMEKSVLPSFGLAVS
jgi:nucleoside-diphosphate-sugar epimerase